MKILINQKQLQILVEQTQNSEKIYNRPGDPYEYKYQNNTWFARKKGTNGNFLDITKYQKSIDILNKEFPQGNNQKPATQSVEKPAAQPTTQSQTKDTAQSTPKPTQDNKNVKVEINFADATKKVIYKLEGGYYHPDMLKDGRVKDPRYGGSGETMFGIDRKTGGFINTSSAGKEFWKLIDDANARSTWKWNYFGGSLEKRLMDLVVKMMEPIYNSYSKTYLTPQALSIVNSSKKLLFHFVYATWNGGTWFKIFAKIINNAVANGETNPRQLEKLAIDSRKNSSNSLIAQGADIINQISNA